MNKQQLKNDIQEMKEKLQKMELELEASERRWEPSLKEQYFSFSDEGLTSSFNQGTFFDEWKISRGEAFRTFEECDLDHKRKCLTKKYLDFLHELNDGWIPDWENEMEDKYGGFYCNYMKEYQVAYYSSSQEVPSKFFIKKDFIKEIKDKFTEAELKLIITGEE